MPPTKKNKQYVMQQTIVTFLSAVLCILSLQLCNASTLANDNGGQHNDKTYVLGQRRVDNPTEHLLTPIGGYLQQPKTSTTSNNSHSSTTGNNETVNKLINLSNLNVSLNHNKLKGYKLRELFSKISINGSEPIIERQLALKGGQSGDTHMVEKNRNDIEVISVDLKDVEIPFKFSGFGSTVETSDQSSNGAVAEPIRFTQNHLTMTGVNLRLLNMQLYKDNEPKCDIQFMIGNTTINGRFSVTTDIMLMEVHLEGRYTMQVDDVYVKATTRIAKQNTGAPSLRTKDLDLNITSLGKINLILYNDADEEGTTSNDQNSILFRFVNRLLHKTMKKTYYMLEKDIKQSLEGASRKSLDDELSNFVPYLSYNTSQQQDLVASVRQEMIKSNYVTTKLPDYQHSSRLPLGLEAKIDFTNGLLSDIDTLKITGDSKIKIQDLHLLVNTSIGWSQLAATYDWHLNLGIKGRVKFSIKEVAFDAVIIKRLFPLTKLTLEELKVVKLDSVKMDLSGLPGLNTATKSAVNFFMRNMKKRLIDFVQPILKIELEKTLQNMRLFEL